MSVYGDGKHLLWDAPPHTSPFLYTKKYTADTADDDAPNTNLRREGNTKHYYTEAAERRLFPYLSRYIF